MKQFYTESELKTWLMKQKYSETIATEEFLEYIFNAFKIWVIVQKWEAGIRVRTGKHMKKLKPGVHFKIPYFDSVYVQEVRLRIVSMPTQTITTKDGLTISILAAGPLPLCWISPLGSHIEVFKPALGLSFLANTTLKV